MKPPFILRKSIMILACSVWVCGLAQAETVITVKEKAVIDGPRVRLGDIATIAGTSDGEALKLTQADIAGAPRPGFSKEIDSDYLLVKLRQQGYRMDEVVLNGARSVTAARASQTVEPDDLEAVLRKYIASHMPWEAADAVINIQPPREIAGLPSGNVTYRFECDGTYRYVGETSFRVEVDVDRQPCRTVYVRASVHPFEEVAVSLRDIRRGQLLQEGDFSMVRMDLAGLKGDFLTHGTALAGLVATRSIRAGSVVSREHVDRPIAIKRGQMITAQVTGAGFRVSALVKAMDNGRAGDTIRLTNPNSRKNLLGEVLNESTVRVIP